jgi:hypothetical protein
VATSAFFDRRSIVVNELNTTSMTDKKKEGLFTAIYIGAIFILIAVIYFIHLPNSLWDEIVKFFSSVTLAEVPGTGIGLPAPSDPTIHMQLYSAAFQFSLGMGIIEIVILVLRVVLYSSVSRKAETVENIVFWLGTSYLVITYLVSMTRPSEWFVFWAGIILLFGLSLVARAFILIANRHEA